MPFIKGQSGNPSGKRKDGKPRKQHPARVLATSRAKEMLSILIDAARRGDTKAAQIVLEHGVGKPNQAQTLTGSDGGPVTVTWLPTQP